MPGPLGPSSIPTPAAPTPPTPTPALTAGTYRHYQVSAINYAGTGPASAMAGASTPVDFDVNSSLIPAGLGEGDSFRLLFLSSTRRALSSIDIADYNTFVQDRATNGHESIQPYANTFRAVGSTGKVDARDNTSTTYTTTSKGVPIYWVAGNKVADDYEDFYDGEWDDEANVTNEAGGTGLDTSDADNFPGTGSRHDGTEKRVSSTLSRALGRNNVAVGRPNSDGSNHGPLSSNTHPPKAALRPVYGLSPVFTVVMATAPDAITNLAATATSSTQIDLDWSAPDANGATISGYRIEVSPDGTSNWTELVASTGTAASSYSHTGLTPGTTRHYRVSAINAIGTGPASNVDGATTPFPPGAPTDLSARAEGATRIDLVWSAPGSDGGGAIRGYRIEVSTNAGAAWTDLVTDTRSTATAYSHTGLTPGAYRHYRVSAINAVGTGPGLQRRRRHHAGRDRLQLGTGSLRPFPRRLLPPAVPLLHEA